MARSPRNYSNYKDQLELWKSQLGKPLTEDELEMTVEELLGNSPPPSPKNNVKTDICPAEIKPEEKKTKGWTSSQKKFTDHSNSRRAITIRPARLSDESSPSPLPQIVPTKISESTPSASNTSSTRFFLNSSHTKFNPNNTKAKTLHKFVPSSLSKGSEYISTLLQDEYKYVASLTTLVQRYGLPLKSNLSGLNPQDHSVIFSEYEKLSNYHKDFLVSLQNSMDKWKEGQYLSIIMLLKEQYEMFYSHIKYEENIGHLFYTIDMSLTHNKTFEAFMKTLGKTTVLMEGLRLPLDRICIYETFYNNIKTCLPLNSTQKSKLKNIKFTLSSSLSDVSIEGEGIVVQYVENMFNDLSINLSTARSRASNISTLLPLCDSISHLPDEKQFCHPDRKLIKEGKLSVFQISTSSPSATTNNFELSSLLSIKEDQKVVKDEYMFYLFNDMIMYVKEKGVLDKLSGLLNKDSISPLAITNPLPSSEKGEKYSYVDSLLLVKTKIHELTQKELVSKSINPSLCVQLEEKSSKVPKKLNIIYSSESEKNEWMSKLSSMVDELINTKVFGVELTALMRREKSRGSKCCVPHIVSECCQFIQTYGTKVEGIFRVGGSVSQVDSLIKKLDLRGNGIDYFISLEKQSEISSLLPQGYIGAVHIVASLLRRLLKELPIPLLTFEYYAHFVNIFSIQLSDTDRLKLLAGLLGKIPLVNQYFLVYLIDCCTEIIKNIDETKMSASNLAIVFSPTWLTSPDEMSVNSFQESHAASKVVELILDNPWVVTELRKSRDKEQQQLENENTQPTVTPKQIRKTDTWLQKSYRSDLSQTSDSIAT